ncbi:MAG: hypothetical protein ACI85Q_000745 [Salibacteraceae bacterium]|jgi:hypothetical protein
MTKFIVLSIFTILFSSCAFHSGLMTGNTSITNSDFKYVALAQGSAITTHVFGIGGLKKKALVFEAKKDLLKNYPLRKGQALANVTVDLKRTYVFCVVRTRMTVTADVIDFNTEDQTPSFDSLMIENYEGEYASKFGLDLSDSVYISLHGNIRKGEILHFEKHGARVAFLSKDGREYKYTSPYETTLLKYTGANRITEFGYGVDEPIRFLNDSGKVQDGVIFGINKFQVGVKYDFEGDGSFSWIMVPTTRIQKLR